MSMRHSQCDDACGDCPLIKKMILLLYCGLVCGTPRNLTVGLLWPHQPRWYRVVVVVVLTVKNKYKYNKWSGGSRRFSMTHANHDRSTCIYRWVHCLLCLGWPAGRDWRRVCWSSVWLKLDPYYRMVANSNSIHGPMLWGLTVGLITDPNAVCERSWFYCVSHNGYPLVLGNHVDQGRKA